MASSRANGRPRRNGRVTIRDVAERAGVSIAAVSRVLTGSGYSSREMSERVQAAIDELGYRPLAAARAMRGQARTIGVMLPQLRNVFLPDLVDVILDYAGRKGYTMTTGVAYDAAAQADFYATMEDQQTAGIVALSPKLDLPLLEAIGARQPLVIQAHEAPTEHFDAIGIDEALACRLAVEHLAGLGHERIGWVAPSAERPPHALTFRTATFVRTMEDAGLEAIVETVPLPDLAEGGREGTLALLDRPDPPTAILLPTDFTALGTTRALAERGLRMPDDVSVMTFDNTMLAALPALSLTSIDQHARELGRVAARLLFERIEDGRTHAVRALLTPSLVVRSSTGPAPLRPARRASRARAAAAPRAR